MLKLTLKNAMEVDTHYTNAYIAFILTITRLEDNTMRKTRKLFVITDDNCIVDLGSSVFLQYGPYKTIEEFISDYFDCTAELTKVFESPEEFELVFKEL